MDQTTSKIEKYQNFIQTSHGKVWYESIGNGEGIPLIVIHGGPGCPHDYLEPLEDLGASRKVIFYDQIGCGLSDRLDDPNLMNVKTFVNELEEIIGYLKISRFNLLGQSWGAGLACSFALNRAKGLNSIILSDPYLSTPVWEKDAERLIKTLPLKTQKAMNEGDIDSREFKAASKEYYKKYVSRLKVQPKAFDKMLQGFSDSIYETMWGPKEFMTTGTLKSFDLVSQLHKILYPVLLITGRFDEATPESAEYFKSLLPNAKLEIFENSAHYPFWSERAKFMGIVESFLESGD